MEQRPAFSFVMPAYKRQFLAEAIESILGQTFGDFELIVVNDASPEDLGGVVSRYSDPRLRYVENAENMGGRDLVAHWNRCLELARGTFVVLATDDDLLSPAYLADAKRLLDRYPEVDLVRQGVRKIGPDSRPLEFELFTAERLSAAELAYFWGCCGLISCVSNFVFRREALLRRGGFVSFPRAHYSDVATALALAAKGVAAVQAYNVGFRMSAINLSNRSDLPLVNDQLAATTQFLDWLYRFLRDIPDDSPDRLFANRAFMGFKSQYKAMLSSLLAKMPPGHLLRVVRTAAGSPFLYKKERLRLLIDYIIG